MAKIPKAPTDEAQALVAETKMDAQPMAPASITPADDPGKNAIAAIKLNFGEVILVAIDAGGNEGIPFKVNESTYRTYYQNEDKFRLKKTFQP